MSEGRFGALTGVVYAVGRGVARRSPAVVRDRLLRLRPLSAQTGIWYLPEKRLIYVLVPKVASRSVLAALTAYVTGASTESTTRADVFRAMERYVRGAYPPELRRLQRDNFMFTFVRNPLDRLLSAYSQQMAIPKAEAKTIFQRHKIPLDVSFARFVEIVCSVDDDRADGHIRSQHRYLSERDELLVDFVGRFEQLDQEWESLRQRFALPDLPRRNISSHRSVQEAYTPRLARLAAERYRRDIELFGYQDAVGCLL